MICVCILVCLLTIEGAVGVFTDMGLFQTFPCNAHAVEGVKYRKVSWYKVIGATYQGLIMKNLHDNQTTLYQGVEHVYNVAEDFSLHLPESAYRDCGTYQCTLWPPLGERMQDGQYSYYPPGCVKPTEGLHEGYSPVKQSGYGDNTRNTAVFSACALGISLIGISLYVHRKRQSTKDIDTI